jgi:hypothetical protein
MFIGILRRYVIRLAGGYEAENLVAELQPWLSHGTAAAMLSEAVLARAEVYWIKKKGRGCFTLSQACRSAANISRDALAAAALRRCGGKCIL